MFFKEGGIDKKYICPYCKGDNVGKSGLGDKLVNCFNCMIHICKCDCLEEVISSDLDLEIARQDFT